jgi:cytochrome P450
LINKLDFATAVIKETLRLYPPVSAVRSGDGTFVTFNDISYPTKNEMVWIQTHSLQRRPDLFPEPDSFIPERFLSAPNNFQDIPKDAWRPFEKGPRACLGQELVMLEIKIVLALTLRDFDVESAYEEWDRKLGREKPGDTLNGKRGMFGRIHFKLVKDNET